MDLNHLNFIFSRMKNVNVFHPIWIHWYIDLWKVVNEKYVHRVITMDDEDPKVIAIMKEVMGNVRQIKYDD